ncbi:multidrug transporter [Haloterrigena salifodinae]|uniref:Multidrug transporter n=1 Tax=Haloterrigena salifodinae TaxID=2675099 RepID=A0A8T8E5Q4_9EURY|nr:multidrug transporter [Haloterrigena salifodinae]QRV17194.1 multidrug transporter [Haloterrigena salifodinae]
MTFSIGRSSSSIGTAIGLAAVLVAIVGTQFLGWEWGSGQLVPTLIGVVAAVVALVTDLSRRD